MDKFGKAQPVKRVEDVRFLTGQGRYSDDIAPENALYGYFLRSQVAHADITTLDTSDAAEMDGVVAIFTADDLNKAGVTGDCSGAAVTNRDGTKGAKPRRPTLAEGRVRFVGETIALIVATNLNAARDAAEMIEVDFDERPVHLGQKPGGTAIHDEAPNNQAFDWGLGDEAATNAAFDAAAHTVSLEVEDNRVIATSMEARAVWAEPVEGRLHVNISGQGVWNPKSAIAKYLNMSKDDVRVTNPDVGGGFGMKAMTYPEDLAIAFAARTLGQPVRWFAERGESMMSDNAGRDLVSLAEFAFDADHKITAYRLKTHCNLGAYNSGFAQFIQTELFSKVLTGTYDVPAGYMNVVGTYTNTTPVDAYRGAGRPEAIYVLERLIDHAARELGVDPWDLRRKNFIRPDAFPYTTVTEQPYDVGEFAKVLARVEAECDKAGFPARKAEAAKRGKLLGQGLCYYIESILGAPDETTRVVFENGGAKLFVGTQSNGQGHETVFASFLSDHTGIPMERIELVQGDSDAIPSGGGTGGSRSVTVQNTATLANVDKMIEGFTAFLAELEGASATDISFDDERFRIPGSNLTPTMLEVADLAREHGRDDLLDVSATIKLDNRSFPNGAHVAEVEIDPETGVTEVVRYTVTDDFGNLINPMLVEGQIHGGVAQGIGQAITEHVVFDEDGQLLTASFMDYGLPRADNMPMIDFTTEGTPSLYNPMGMKGCGEAGTVGALAAVSNATLDALSEVGVTRVDMPFTPLRVWEMIQNAKADAAA
ncbi:xanthine dehydrogenase family protein molybdopterin-binding subunit [Shimia ponticola]|uniref:xanthine dehydrogenase family protein molybdopterin-binding subunit n=1 Tax=Shimia ponticola TaxID=2582893 RepID=UPI0011BE652F|nr:xanthine dehydrogenase family protein molybdopterin-binding subunit [Shimia ponticola]